MAFLHSVSVIVLTVTASLSAAVSGGSPSPQAVRQKANIAETIAAHTALYLVFIFFLIVKSPAVVVYIIAPDSFIYNDFFPK
jgi:hypothetical protein